MTNRNATNLRTPRLRSGHNIVLGCSCAAVLNRRTHSLAGVGAAAPGRTIIVVVPDYRGFRIEIVAQEVDRAWNAGVRIRRVLSDMKPHIEQVTCRKPTPIEAEQAGEIWGRRWVDRYLIQATPR